MFDSELASANKRNGGADWIGKRDLELKAFHNELTGVDYANNDSINEILPVYWNTVTTGTKIALAKKFTMANINDGLCTRVAIAPMVSDHFQMLALGDYQAYCQRRERLLVMANGMSRMRGELPIGRLVEHVYRLCKQAAADAESQNDLVLDTLRRRAVFYATWFTIPMLAQRAGYDAAKVEVTDQDLRFATLMFDAVVYWQDSFFGQMLQESWENGERTFAPRLRRSRNAEQYAALPREFTTDDVARELNVNGNAASSQCGRWLQKGYVERTGQGRYKKITDLIV
jgi:hypothetical protein